MPRMSVEVAYNRRWFLGEKVTDNTLRGPEDYESFTITAPSDPRLPGGGGYPITLNLVTQAASDRGTQNYVTFETDFGPERTQHWDGVDFTLNARLRQGLTLQFGTQTGRSVLDTCATAQNIDGGGVIKDLRNCRDVDPFQTTIRGLASYTVPKVDVLVSGTVRSQPPLERSPNWAFPNTLIRDATRTGCHRAGPRPATRPSTSWTPTIGCLPTNGGRRSTCASRRSSGSEGGAWTSASISATC